MEHILEQFSVRTFRLPDGRTIDYNLYEPKGMRAGEKYPLVLFIHDMGACSPDVRKPLTQGRGAVAWAEDAELGTRRCFVVAPQYPEKCANDDFEVTWEADATVELVKRLAETYPVDVHRIYGTGQSMGCMVLCELMLRNPRFFAGCLLVAGQWNPERMAPAKVENLWGVVAEGDFKAFPILGACFDGMEREGGFVARGHADAKAPQAELEEVFLRQKARGSHLNFTWFEGKSILPEGCDDNPGMHHMATWGKAYDIETLRAWLFEQKI